MCLLFAREKSSFDLAGRGNLKKVKLVKQLSLHCSMATSILIVLMCIKMKMKLVTR